MPKYQVIGTVYMESMFDFTLDANSKDEARDKARERAAAEVGPVGWRGMSMSYISIEDVLRLVETDDVQ